MKHPLSCFCGRTTFAPPSPLPSLARGGGGGAFLRRGETEREEEDRLFIKAVNPRMEKSMRMCRMEKLFSSKGFEKVV